MFRANFISMPVNENMYSLNGSKVHSIFKNVVNFEYRGKLVSIQSSNVPKGPLSISIDKSIDFLDLPIKVGDVITLKRDVICIGNISVNIERPLIWDPTLKYYSLLLCNNKILTSKIKSLVILNGKTGGVKEEVLSTITGDSYRINERNESNFENILKEVYLDFYNKNKIDAAMKLSSLIGYGAGLTPAGDDFLVGVMSVLQCCKSDSEIVSEFYEKLCTEISKNSHKTTMVSKTFLEEGTNAHFSESFHKLYEAITMENSEELYKAAISMMSIGHSSGTDGLCGVLWGFYLVSNININGG